MWRELTIFAIAFGLGTSVGAVGFGGALRSPGEVAVQPREGSTSVDPIDPAPADTRDRVVSGTAMPPATGAPGSPEVQRQLDAMAERWAELAERFEQLQAQVASLEAEFGAPPALPLSEMPDGGLDSGLAPAAAAGDQRAALSAAGVPDTLAEDLIRRQARKDMARLDLQDRASREGWLRSDRYFEALEELDGGDFDIRAEIGDEAYDRFLFSIGESNRIQVSSVIPGSQAEKSGLMPGDVIERYDGRRLFAPGELRSATTQGMRDEFVAVQVRRGDGLIDTWLQRGPLGVRIGGARAAPDG